MEDALLSLFYRLIYMVFLLIICSELLLKKNKKFKMKMDKHKFKSYQIYKIYRNPTIHYYIKFLYEKTIHTFFIYIQKKYILIIRKHSIPFSWFPYVAETDPSAQQYTKYKLSFKVDRSTWGVLGPVYRKTWWKTSSQVFQRNL